MDKKIQKILEEAGVFKGLTRDEAAIMLALGSSALLKKAKTIITEKAFSGEISQKELAQIFQILDTAAEQYRNAQQTAILKVAKKKQELVDEYLVKAIAKEEKKQKTLEVLEQKLAVFLSA